MIDPDVLPNDWVDSLTQRGHVSSRQVAVPECWGYKSSSGACYMGGKEV
jgi:hypothetical protein